MIKKLALLIALMVGLTSATFANEQQDDKALEKERPKVGLVLAGGGAKGAAHIGVIKLIEEIGIPVDYIAGTSMGSIIGGLYALGYNSAEMDSIISNMDWSLYMSNKMDRREVTYDQKVLSSQYLVEIPFDITKKLDTKMKMGLSKEGDDPLSQSGKSTFMNSLPGGYINGNSIFNMMNSLAVGYQDSIDFNKLPIPFACVSVNAVTGTQKIHRDGRLPMAMRASMAIPGVFTPVQMGDELLVDGGMLNNFPVDVCKSMGADIIIGVNLSGGLTDDIEKLEALPGLLGQLFAIVTGNQVEEHSKMCNIYLNPNLKEGGYGTLSFDKESIQDIMEIGYNTALQKLEEFKALKKELEGYGVDLAQKYNGKKALNLVTTKVDVNDYLWPALSESEVSWLEKKTGLKDLKSVTKDDLDKAVSVLYGTKAFSKIVYNVRKSVTDSTKYDVEFDLTLNEPNSFRLGFRFDSYETAALGFRFGWNENKLRGFKAVLATRLSYTLWVKAAASYAAGTLPNINLEYFFKTYDVDIYDRGAPYTHLGMSRQDVKLFLSQFYSKYLGSGLGLDMQMYRTLKVMSETESDMAAFHPINALGVFGYFDFDNRDKDVFPNRGIDLNLNGSWNFYQFGKGHDGAFQHGKMSIGQAYGSFSSYIPVTSRLTLIPQIYASFVFGRDAYYDGCYPIFDHYGNFIGGGGMMGRYFQQELPFVGINNVEYLYNNAVILRMDVRYRVAEKLYLTLMPNYVRDAAYIDKFFDSEYMDDIFGVGAQIGFDSALGPISLDVHWADHNKKFGAYLNIGHYF
jgi:NTE family protein